METPAKSITNTRFNRKSAIWEFAVFPQKSEKCSFIKPTFRLAKDAIKIPAIRNRQMVLKFLDMVKAIAKRR